MEQTSTLIEFLTRVSTILGDRSLRLPDPERSSLAAFVENGLLARIRADDAPLNVVFAGPTGSGKSTLINSVAGRPVTKPGVLRPTTTRSLVYSHVRGDSTFFSQFPYDSVMGKAPILESFTLVDTPDLDSTNRENRRKAMDALSRSDIVVFVTSALRYSDLVPWATFRDIADRGIPIIFVLNRVSSSTSGVVTDFRRRARDQGMSMRVVRVEEHNLDTGAMLPTASIRELRRALVSFIPSQGDSARRIDRGVGYVVAGLESLRRRVIGDQEAVLRLRDELKESLSFPGNIDLGSRAKVWADRLNAVPGWTLRRRWLPILASIADDILKALAVAIESDLQLITTKGSRLVVDLTTNDGATVNQPTEQLLRSWFEGVDPPGSIDNLDHRHARSKIASALRAIESLADVMTAEAEEATPASAAELRITIEKIYLEAVNDLESLSLRREIEALESTIDASVRSEPIVANA